MTNTRRLTVALGFGSGERAAEFTQNNLEKYTNYDDVVVFSLSHALDHPDELSEAVDGADVVTHSAGALATSLAISEYPTEVPRAATIIGGPIPTDSYRLVMRASRIFANETLSSIKNLEEARLSLLHTSAMGSELGRHALHHFGSISAISRFDSFQFGNMLASKNVDTTIVSMEEDEFFEQASRQFQKGLQQKDDRVTVVSLEGGHCRFSKRPARVLGEVAEKLYTGQLLVPQTINSEPNGLLQRLPLPALA